MRLRGIFDFTLDRVWGYLRKEAERKGWNQRQRLKREIEVATEYFRGIDKDAFLAKVCKAYMALVGDGRGGVFCANSLLPWNDWPSGITDKVRAGQFNVGADQSRLLEIKLS